jgi:phosphohistidine phosphatase
VERFSKTSNYRGPVDYLDSLYLAEPAAYLAAAREHGGAAQSLLLVGHNPGLESLVTALTGERLSLPTAALVECTLDVETWSDVTEDTSAELTAVSYPRDD